jgi:uncharacterized membrane protein (UPF0127 family)
MIYATLVFWMTLNLISCSPKLESGFAPSNMPTKSTTKSADHTVSFLSAKGPLSFVVEIVTSPADVQKGLMFRKSLALDHGMLFAFPNEAPRTFWMKNTLISLDMIFMNSDKIVVGVIANAKPLSLDTLSIAKPARYVLEINAGLAKQRGIEVGVQAQFATDP